MLFSLNRAALGAGLIAVILTAGGTASAQSSGRQLSALDCACIDLAIRDGRREIALRKAAYEEQTRALARLEAELARLKPQVDVENQASVDGFRMKLEERESAKEILQNNTLPDYQSAVSVYNENLATKDKRCPPVIYDEASFARNFPGQVCRR